ncbi:hypothetical protein CDSE_0331 [Candidatus Kinetoplastibacterium desouzaii TCC079E]|uniref:EamA domain-containing protein n=1 Tax=Candidatus Kinetoplastidibacterium desouzai TCC079E TaxID=1208919 RepID=M1M320_9PROT|nr:EamA family transporter [Candidatus Kinetoplastibacterium desouzaii]AGF46670.1 hypothetical protein CDSE_0331 [Candidatus Kinetoplastibacterium desouzaii TCC079E]
MAFVYVIISIICSVSVSLILKTISKKNTNLLPSLFFSYITTLLACIFFFPQNISTKLLESSAILISLGILFPVGFISMSKSIYIIGIAKSEVIQRSSIFISLMISFVVYNEVLTKSKMFAIFLAPFAILLMITNKQSHNIKNHEHKNLFSLKYEKIWILILLLSYGTVDILLKELSKKELVINILSVSFLISAISLLFYLALTKNIKTITLSSLKSGLLIGSLNFCNIYNYIKAHKEMPNDPSVIFILMNFGVILLGLILGIKLFGERVTMKNYIGIAITTLIIISITN